MSILAANEQVNPVDLLNDVMRLKNAGLVITTCLHGIMELLEVLLGLGWRRSGKN